MPEQIIPKFPQNDTARIHFSCLPPSNVGWLRKGWSLQAIIQSPCFLWSRGSASSGFSEFSLSARIWGKRERIAHENVYGPGRHAYHLLPHSAGWKGNQNIAPSNFRGGWKIWYWWSFSFFALFPYNWHGNNTRPLLSFCRTIQVHVSMLLTLLVSLSTTL